MRGIAPYPAPDPSGTAIRALRLSWRSQSEPEWRHRVNPDDPIEWRPGQGVEMRRTVVVDGPALAAELGVNSLPPLRCSLMWSGSRTQGIAASATVMDTDAIVGIDLVGLAPGTELADAVRITTRISAEDLIPGLAPGGAILWEESAEVPLSGSAPALTIRSTSFAGRGLPPRSWCVVKLPDDPHDHPSAIEVLLDAEAPVDIEGLMSGDGPGSDLAVELVLLAISDALIAWSLERAEDLEQIEISLEESETVASVAMNQIERVFLGRSPTEVVELRESEPTWFASCLQARAIGRHGLLDLAARIGGSA